MKTAERERVKQHSHDNTAKLTQPMSNMAAPMRQDIAREQRCERGIILFPIGLTRWMCVVWNCIYLVPTHMPEC